MHLSEFDQQRNDLTCRHCNAVGLSRKQVGINSWEPFCPRCRTQHPIPGVQYLKQTNRKPRKDYPMGETVDEVWARFDDRCVVCSTPKAVLERANIPLERQHVAPYASHGHQGPLVPMCILCHREATDRQKLMAFFLRAIETPDESVLGSGPDVSPAGLPSDPLPTAS